MSTHTCSVCGCLVDSDLAEQHYEFHQEVADLRRDLAAINRDLTEVAKVVKRIVLERNCETPPTLKELGL